MGDIVISFIFFENGECLFKKSNTKVELNITDCWEGFNKNTNSQKDEIINSL